MSPSPQVEGHGGRRPRESRALLEGLSSKTKALVWTRKATADFLEQRKAADHATRHRRTVLSLAYRSRQPLHRIWP